MLKFLAKLGKAFMLPIAILPAAGLLLGIGGALSNATTVKTYPFLALPILQGIFQVMASAGSAVFTNISLLLAVGLALGLAKNNKGVAALSAVVAFLVMNATIDSMISIFKPFGMKSIDTGTIGSIIIGLMVSSFHNKYQNIQLPIFLGFFGGSRFVPIISSLGALFIGIIFTLLWPLFQVALVSAGEVISRAGYLGTFLYGFLLRLTGAVGLHHTIYPLFWWTELGGSEVVNDVNVVGAQNIFFAQLADPNHTGLFTKGTRFFSGRFLTMMFGLPAACLAMYHCVEKKRRSLVVGIMLSSALTSFLTGITEPIEFMFLFVSPLLYLWHALLDGLSFLLADMLSIRIGNTFSGGFIDFILFGILQGNDKTHWLLVLPLGLVWFAFYYLSFGIFITKFNIMTPGRDEDIKRAVKVESKSSIFDLAKSVLEALGGTNNVQEVEACITRLRVSLVDINKVDKAKLKELGGAGVIDYKGGIQVIFGAKSDLIASKINEIISSDD